jgi:septal ring factor EnvC (AmiA/AmiB activator)
MKKILATFVIFFGYIALIIGQTRNELEEQRRKALEEINYVDKLLKETAEEKDASLNELKIIGRKLNLRESVLRGLQEEISLLSNRIELNDIAISMMNDDLEVMIDDYRNAVIDAFRSEKSNLEISYILSAKDFNQGYKRLKYLQQITKFRRQESELIKELIDEIEISRKKIEEDLKKVSELKSREERQKYLLIGEQNRQQKVVKSLSNKEKQLQRELAEKRRIAKSIESEISRLIAEERNKASDNSMSPELRLLSNNFSENKGRLPWPVERGIITSHFGIHNHPVLKYVKENNSDIEITSNGRTPVQAIFDGTVARVFSIPGANMSIIIKHGKYYTVYSNLVNITVKAGEKVVTKKIIGYVYNDEEKGNEAVLKFMITDEKVNLDPELWISKKN